jgi:magnesium chelatase family protein
VLAARARQRDRQGETVNAELSGRDLDRVAPLAGAARTLLEEALSQLGLSARAYDKVRRVARTLADLDGGGPVGRMHVAEALAYRGRIERRRVSV